MTEWARKEAEALWSNMYGDANPNNEDRCRHDKGLIEIALLKAFAAGREEGIEAMGKAADTLAKEIDLSPDDEWCRGFIYALANLEKKRRSLKGSK